MKHAKKNNLLLFEVLTAYDKEVMSGYTNDGIFHYHLLPNCAVNEQLFPSKNICKFRFIQIIINKEQNWTAPSYVIYMKEADEQLLIWVSSLCLG